MRRDLLNNSKIEQTISPTATQAGSTGDSVDITGAESCVVVLDVGDYGDGSFEFTIEEQDDDGSWSAVDASQLEGSLPTVDAAGDVGIHRVGVYSTATNLRVSSTASTTTVDTTYGVSVVLGHLRFDEGPANPATA